MCSYLAMFPPAIPRYFIEQCSQPGDTVLDPFAGRGTAPLEACLAGRVGIGTDLNPLAVILTGAKVNPPAKQAIRSRLEELEALCRGYRERTDQVPAEIRMLFDGRRTLRQLCFLREQLQKDDKTDRYLLAVLCGILHGNHLKQPEKSRTLSISMPNTFSMAPSYVKRYIRKHSLKKYPFDVFRQLEQRMEHLNRAGVPEMPGECAEQDARQVSRRLKKHSVSLIVSSPPYLKLIRYGKYNWIRLWLLRELDETIQLEQDLESIDQRLRLSDQLNLPDYLKFMEECLADWEAVMKPGGLCVLVIGDVQQGGAAFNLAEAVWRHISGSTGFELVDIVHDDFALSDKVTRIWGGTRGRATKSDRLLVLKMPGTRRSEPKSPGAVIRQMRKAVQPAAA